MKSRVQNQPDRLTILDVLKGICVIFVIITHYHWDDTQRLYGLFPFTIDMAVPVFMIITGFLLSNSYINKGITQFEQAYDLEIICKRLIRFSLPFFIAYATEIALFYLQGNRIGIKSIARNFFLGGIGLGSYYYPVLIQITFFLPIILFSMYRHPRTGLGFWFFFNAFYEFSKRLVKLETAIYKLSMFRYTFLLAFGCFLFLNQGKKIKNAYSFAAGAIGFLFILFTRYLGYRTIIINGAWSGTSFMAGLYIAPIIMVIMNHFRSFSCKPLELIGKASYNIFLTQMVYYAAFAERITRFSNRISVHITCNVIICVSIGIVFYLIENNLTQKVTDRLTPHISLLKKRLNKFN